ncbi:hypothetical protein QBC33DRAFT_534475 [Phialemonium atrogriseum]|uniref:Zn(2)-C6 fungal-type domain-containing protein n=1 Tax=Phialemonium atrogriseum TaxID=1093897 RepID=A0AAJ0FQC1_9PEZI|nr:uncharacterized protein QBC33DRAFT_534475 [Phialemonium atrogriseum]KAK1769005.1 hypothetical protein QBC33DRAFT_534475 [Phialemonium atrogriseum]
MSRNNSTTSLLQGFSVFQPTLGATLQWLPALGSKELDNMINAFFPGSCSIQDKRAHISMDFFEYSRQTGEKFKFYPVLADSHSSTTAPSPASSSAMHDSGYGSSFNLSPVAVSDMSPWVYPLSFTPAPTTSQPRTNSRSSPKKKSAVPSSQQADFSSLPGMRIMTKDGRDVTNSASRGCKTKEQRDHAHLMRIIKACDSCRRKKIRCDPSHKKRNASQAQPSQPVSRPAKKAKVTVHDKPLVDFGSAGLSLLVADPSLELDLASADLALQSFADPADDLWEQFVCFGQETPLFSDNYDFFSDPAGHLSSSSGSSSTSPSQLFTPSTLIPSAAACGLPPGSPSLEPTLPYLNPDGHGSSYVDFNLYSPVSDFLDEELQPMRKPQTGARGQDGPSYSLASCGEMEPNPGTTSLHDPVPGDASLQVGRLRLDHGLSRSSHLPCSVHDRSAPASTDQRMGREQHGVVPSLGQTRPQLSPDDASLRIGSGVRAAVDCPIGHASEQLFAGAQSTSPVVQQYSATAPWPSPILVPPPPLPGNSSPRSSEGMNNTVVRVHGVHSSIRDSTNRPRMETQAPLRILRCTPASTSANTASGNGLGVPGNRHHHNLAGQHTAWSHPTPPTEGSPVSGQSPSRGTNVPSRHGTSLAVSGAGSVLAHQASRGSLTDNYHLHDASDAVRFGLEPTAGESLMDYSCPLLSGLVVALALLYQLMRHVLTRATQAVSKPLSSGLLMSISFCHVLISGLVCCLKVSDTDSQNLGRWSNFLVAIALGGAILLACDSRQPNSTAQRLCGPANNRSTIVNASRIVEPKIQKVLIPLRRFQSASTKQLVKQLAQLGSIQSAGF